MEFNNVIKKRKSVRDFTKKKANWRAVLDAIEIVNQGPFAGNINNLKFLIIEEPDTIKKIAKFAEQTWISRVGILVLICSDETHLENIYGERGRVYSRQQAGAAIYAFLLKIAELGLAGCWVGAYTDERIKEILGIPQNIQIEAIIPVGYEEKGSKEKPNKKELENVIYWETWKNSKRPTIFKEPKDPLALKS